VHFQRATVSLCNAQACLIERLDSGSGWSLKAGFRKCVLKSAFENRWDSEQRADLSTRLRAREPFRGFTINAAKEVVSRASLTLRIADTI
jgi:tellurite resistance protein